MARKVYVVYASLTGNTRKVAEAMARAVNGELVNARKAALPKVGPEDVVFVGCGVYFGRPTRSFLRALQAWDLPKGLKVVLFGTYGGRPAQFEALERVLREKGSHVVGRFSCPGRDWFVLGLLQRGRPSAEDLKSASEFAKRTFG